MRDMASFPTDLIPAASFVALNGIGVAFGNGASRLSILEGISLAIGSGETVAITGPSGSGKSTLMSVMGGLERPSAGRIAVGGTDITALSEDKLARFRRDNIGIVFQSFHLVPTMTAEENTAIPLELAGRADARKVARGMLEQVGLGHRLHHYPSQLSGGEQQRVAIARAIAPRPGLLLADEPTGNLDSRTGRVVIDLLFSLQAQSGATLVLVTHDPALAQRCARVIGLADGRVAGDERRLDAERLAEPAGSAG